jgi:lysyl-tRNA synthetase class 2
VLAAGLPRIYEIGPCFRGREGGPWHGTEFTMLEWYRAGAELLDLMHDVQELVAVAAEATGRDAPGSWSRWTVRDLVADRTGLDLRDSPVGALQAAAHAPDDPKEPWDEAFFRLWLDRVEPTLSGAVFVEDWPASQAALARVRTDGPWPVACRFEAYVNGVELANAFLELTDATELARRFAVSASARTDAGEAPHPVDPALLDATHRMPRTCGIALGVDRLVAAVMGWPGIGPGRVAVDPLPA